MISAKQFLQSLDSSRISILSKWMTLITGILVFVFFKEILLLTENPAFLLLALAFENTILLNAFLPLGLISLLTAKYALSQGLWGWLISGYLAALIANTFSFVLGKYIRTKTNGKDPEPHSIPLTFWHPNLASLTAFSEGLRGRNIKNYLLEAVPWSFGWFSTICFAIYLLPEETRSTNTFTYVAFGILILWILLPTIKETFFNKK
ncbi:MAG: hypothetical protein ACJKSS_02215 [Patescibacteria group bacterium UBA2103]